MKKIVMDFMPRNDGRSSFWMSNLNQKIALVGPTVGLTPTEISELETATQENIDACNRVESKKCDLEEAVNAKKELRKTTYPIIRNAIARIKRMPGYTQAIGGQLGIIASSSLIDTNTIKPSVKLAIVAGNVNVSFNKKKLNTISIFTRIRGTYEWTKIAQVSTSPYIDSRPLASIAKAETREYMVMCHDGDKEVGLESDVAVIVVGG